MKHLLPLILLLAPVIAGCPPEVIPYRSQSSVERSYTLGVAKRVARGEPILAVRSMTNAPLYEVAFDYTPPQHDAFMGGLDYPPLSRGMRFVQVATRGDGAIGLARNGYGVRRPGSLTRRETYLPVVIWISKQGIVSGSMEGRRWTTDALFLPTAGASAPVEAARIELTFDGAGDGMIDATHREVYGNPSTPAEERRVRFQIGDDRRFVHEGLTVEVVSVASDALEFRVVDEAGLAEWLNE